jgi:hypothetical protein
VAIFVFATAAAPAGLIATGLFGLGLLFHGKIVPYTVWVAAGGSAASSDLHFLYNESLC